MLKKCRDCGNPLYNDKKSGHYWCVNCKDIKEVYDLKYKICILGKNTGKDVGENNFIKRLGQELENLGHEVIQIRFGDIYKHIETWEITECFVDKKKINLEFIYYIYNPDFIMVEQTYNRFDVSGVKCPVIYLHREYTHFPDIEDPDMLLTSYPNRLSVFEFFYPNQYANIPYADELFVAVEDDVFNPDRPKVIKGISMPSWASSPYSFANANGVFCWMVVDDQVGFYQECVKKGYVTYMDGGDFTRFKGLLEQMEAILIDGGAVGIFGRRIFEAMASKVLCIVRVHNVKAKEIYDKLGVTDDMCFFIYDPDDIKSILDNWNEEENRKKVEKAYEWVMTNHTYKVRTKELLEKFEEFKKGVRKKEKFMGYALHSDIEINDGELKTKELI